MPPKILFIDPAGEILGGTLLGILSVDLAGERLIITGRLGRKNLDTAAGEDREVAERYSREIDISAGDEVLLLGD